MVALHDIVLTLEINMRITASTQRRADFLKAVKAARVQPAIKRGSRVLHSLAIADAAAICGTVVKLLPGWRCKVRLDDGDTIVEDVRDFCPIAG
jgi:hypothetical protein